MEISSTKVHGFGIQFKEVKGEKFYCLADIMNALDKRPTLGNCFKETAPINLSGRIVWRLRCTDAGFVYDVFVDGDCMESLFSTYLRK